MKDHTSIAEQQAMLLDTAPVQMWVLSDCTTYSQVNQFHADFVGKPKDDLVGRNLHDIFPDDIAKECELSNRQVLETGGTVVSEEWVTDSHGVNRLLQITKTPWFDDRGDIGSIVCFALDVTDRKATEQALQQSEENFRALVETMSDLVLVMTLDGRIQYCNPASCKRLEYPEEELLNLSILDLHPAHMREEAKAITTEMVAGRQHVCPLPVQTKSGKLLPVETRVCLGRWDDTDCIIGISKDLSAEQEALQKFDRFFQMNPALMAVTRLPERDYVNVNDSFLETLEYTKQEVIGKTPTELRIFVDPDEASHARQLLLRYGRIRDIEMCVRTKSGKIRRGLFSGDVIESQGARYFLSVMIDITERKRAEDESRRTIDELKLALIEIRKLQGFVPICANCKKIRDDKGYWEQIEEYFAKHPVIEFSHSMCPDCYKELYPDSNVSNRGNDDKE